MLRYKITFFILLRAADSADSLLNYKQLPSYVNICNANSGDNSKASDLMMLTLLLLKK